MTVICIADIIGGLCVIVKKMPYNFSVWQVS